MSGLLAEPTFVFPPALAQSIREHAMPASLSEVTDDQLVELVTTIFFAGLETHEGEHTAVGVAFLGRSTQEFVMVEGAAGEVPLYRWKVLRFESPRPFASRELVKLSVAGADRRIYVAVGVLDNGSLAITGLAREGVNAGPDPFIRIVASRPGCLSIRCGRDLAIEYERGVIVAVGDDEVFSAGPVRRALMAIAHSADMDDDVIPRFLDAIVALVGEIVAHGRGGILIISPDDRPPVAESAPYRMVRDSSLGALLRLAWYARGKGGSEPARVRPESLAFGSLLRNAFLIEAERVIEELGRLTAIDGAVLLNRSLALMAFGVILPVRQQIVIVEGMDAAAGGAHPVDFGSRGTRHRAAATYASEHSGSVVFVASEDGQLSCLLRQQDETQVRLWRLASGLSKHGTPP